MENIEKNNLEKENIKNDVIAVKEKNGENAENKEAIKNLKNIGIKTKLAEFEIADKDKYGIFVKSYTKKFGKFLAVDDLSFGVNRGKIHGFVGPNGAGKTTTIKALIGAFRKSSGHMYIEGKVAGSNAAKRAIGYIPERASFPPHLTCMEYLMTMGTLSGFSLRKSKKEAIRILNELELMKHQHRKPIEFSSGMKKKILIAQAMMLDPTALIMDEPAANLDPSARKELFDKIKEFKAQGKTILLSSHILSELQDIVDEVTFIVQGKIKFTGKMTDLSNRSGAIIKFVDPTNKKTKDFISKYEFKEGHGTHTYLAKSEKEVFDLLASIAKQTIEIQSFSSLRSNLNYFYEQIVDAYGNESGVAREKRKIQQEGGGE